MRIKIFFAVLLLGVLVGCLFIVERNTPFKIKSNSHIQTFEAKEKVNEHSIISAGSPGIVDSLQSVINEDMDTWTKNHWRY